MEIIFDKFDQYNIPTLTLTNPNKQELYSLKLAFDTEISIRFNALSEFKFKFPKSIDGGATTIEAYSYIQNKRLVKVEGYGYFIIVNSVEDSDGSVPIKTVTCDSLESELIQKKVTVYGGTKPLYNIFNPEGTIIQDMLNLAPNWSVGIIDSVLLTKFRTFNISDSNIYNFLMNDVAKAFECVFFFDTNNRTITARAIENSTLNTDIFMSFDNLISKSSFSEKSDEIVTCLNVYGGNDLGIAGVNPLGGNSIYDFSYYANTNWMTQELVNAINSWKSVVSASQSNYSFHLLLVKQYSGELLILEGELSTLNSQYTALETLQKVRIEGGQSYSDITSQMASKQAEIDAKKILIHNKQLQVDSQKAELVSINNSVSFSSNFTEPQLLELNTFIYQNTYKNNNIIKTDIMSDVEIMNAQQDLYEQAQLVLSRVSQPRYEISMDAVNYLVIPEFSVFTSQTQLGSLVTAEITPNVFISTVLLEINFTFDDPSSFSLLFSNRIRIDGSGFVYTDLAGETVKTSSSVSFDSLKWSDWDNNHKDDVTTFITSALDTTTNNLINNANQEILINQNGLRGRTFNPNTHTYDPTQVWLTSSVLAFTDNAFQTSKLALGKVTVNGVPQFGLVAGVIVGNMIAGNTLTITNSGNNFTLDATGATLTNAKFTIQTTNTKVIIDPTSTIPFNIQQNVGGTFTNKFWVDNAGNVNLSGILSGASGSFTGSITATSGTIGGIGINTSIPGIGGGGGIYKVSDPSHYYIAANGNMVWGAISIIGGTTVFNGTVRADQLFGTINWNQVTHVPANTVAAGTTSGVDLSWPGGLAVTGSGGYVSIASPNEIEISASPGGVSSFLLLDNGGISLTSGLNTIISASDTIYIEGAETHISGKIYTQAPSTTGGYGQTRFVTIAVGQRLQFNNGILISVA